MAEPSTIEMEEIMELKIRSSGVSWYLVSSTPREGFYEWRGEFWRHYMTRREAREALRVLK